jgi:hypothetical protein
MAPFGWIFVALALVPGANPKPEPVIVPPALVAPLELPKALPARRDLPRTVLVQVTVGVDGVTSEIGLAPGDTTPSALAQVAIDALKKAGGMPKYTEYPGVGHNSWGPAYNDPELLVWLFGQKLP